MATSSSTSCGSPYASRGRSFSSKRPRPTARSSASSSPPAAAAKAPCTTVPQLNPLERFSISAGQAASSAEAVLEDAEFGPLVRREGAVHGPVYQGSLAELVQRRQPGRCQFSPRDASRQPTRRGHLESRPASLMERQGAEKFGALAERRRNEDFPGERVGLGNPTEGTEKRRAEVGSLSHRRSAVRPQPSRDLPVRPAIPGSHGIAMVKMDPSFVNLTTLNRYNPGRSSRSATSRSSARSTSSTGCAWKVSFLASTLINRRTSPSVEAKHSFGERFLPNNRTLAKSRAAPQGAPSLSAPGRPLSLRRSSFNTVRV